ncbi:hypothetical protein ACKLNR_006597 [Fusarium oxysporum f. sp. zingiberi]
MAVLQDCSPFQRYESQVYVAHNPENSRLSVVGSEPVLKYIHQLAPTRRLTTRQNAKNVGFSYKPGNPCWTLKVLLSI